MPLRRLLAICLIAGGVIGCVPAPSAPPSSGTSAGPLVATSAADATISTAPTTTATRITILVDNTSADPRLSAAPGFAAWVEHGGHAVLFDTGADGSVLENMRRLGLDPRDVEAVVLSHEHSDHTGGIDALLGTGVRPTVYVPAGVPASLKRKVRARTRLVEVRDATSVLPGIHVTHPLPSPRDFPDEQSLAVETRGGTVVITGCAHPGVTNQVLEAQRIVPGGVSLLMGGFHLRPSTDIGALRSIASGLRRMGVQQVMPAHCTDSAAIDVLRAEFGAGCLDGGVGRTVTF